MIQVIAECVTGNHERCKNNSTVCGGSRRPWIYRYLNKNTKLSCTSQDMQILHGCIRYRLNEKNILSTRFQTNTNKTEAVNRAYNLRNPKHLTYSRNFPSRIHSTVHQVNNGPGLSMMLQCASVGNPVAPGSRLSHNLYLRQRRHFYMKRYKQNPEYTRRRYSKRALLYKMYDQNRSNSSYSTDLMNK